MNAIIVHGKPSKETYFDATLPSASNDNWLPWLQKQLVAQGIPTQTPEMINSWQPDYQIWSKEFARYDITPETILIGHSMGAGFIAQWLSEHKDITVGHVFLVAPSLGDRFTPDDPLDHPVLGGFFDFEIDPDLTSRTTSITIFHSDNDRKRVNASVQYLRTNLPGIVYHEFHNYGHFRGKRDMADDSFPELLTTISDTLQS